MLLGELLSGIAVGDLNGDGKLDPCGQGLFNEVLDPGSGQRVLRVPLT